MLVQQPYVNTNDMFLKEWVPAEVVVWKNITNIDYKHFRVIFLYLTLAGRFYDVFRNGYEQNLETIFFIFFILDKEKKISCVTPDIKFVEQFNLLLCFQNLAGISPIIIHFYKEKRPITNATRIPHMCWPFFYIFF